MGFGTFYHGSHAPKKAKRVVTWEEKEKIERHEKEKEKRRVEYTEEQKAARRKKRRIVWLIIFAVLLFFFIISLIRDFDTYKEIWEEAWSKYNV